MIIMIMMIIIIIIIIIIIMIIDLLLECTDLATPGLVLRWIAVKHLDWITAQHELCTIMYMLYVCMCVCMYVCMYV